MTFFAILGFIWYVMACFQLGYETARWWGVWRGMLSISRISRKLFRDMDVFAFTMQREVRREPA
jgi:hypothetical protein